MKINSVLTAATLLAAHTAAFPSTGSISSNSNLVLSWTTDIDNTYTATGPYSAAVSFTESAFQGTFEAVVTADPFPQLVVLPSIVLEVDAPTDPQLRYSYWQASMELTVWRLSDGEMIKAVSLATHGTGKATLALDLRTSYFYPSINYKVTGAYTFAAGNYLSPSGNPSCAALSCMTLNSDNAKFSATVAAVVPEPQTYVLLALGLAGVGGAVRRRR